MKKVALLVLVIACLSAGAVKAETTPAPAVVKKPVERCEPMVGSRVVRSRDANGQCPDSVPFARSYSREQIEQTGQIDLGAALSQLDPAVSRAGR